MKYRYFFILAGLLLASLFMFVQRDSIDQGPIEESEIGEALDHWVHARAYPNDHIPMKPFTDAFWDKQARQAQETGATAAWEPTGPANIAGRTLCLAFNPQNPNTIWAGSASGGLWKSHTAGVGVKAWEQVETGFPVLGIPAIAINPTDSNEIYIGTGEVYWYSNPAPGIVNRLTRGTYGIGILKSTDGGNSWTHSLNWSQGALRGIQKIALNPLRPATVYAATSEGLYRSYDAGANWTLIHSVLMAVDVEIHPVDTNVVFVTHGSLFANTTGVFRSTDGGNVFSVLSNGIPSFYTGKTQIALSASNPDIIYATVANAFQSLGLYRSTDRGTNWQHLSNADVALWQGWYSHDVVVDPGDPDVSIWVGLNCWKVQNAGGMVTEKSSWFKGYDGTTPVGGDEGPPDYVHGDIHAAYFYPGSTSRMFFATDGGVFESTDKAETFRARNGSLQTSQFYANFGNSHTDSSFAIGGMQDNNSALYTGTDAWRRILGGDGMSAAIDPLDDNIVYGSSQGLNLQRSNFRGNHFSSIVPPGQGEPTSFVGPFELAPSAPHIIYAGRNVLYRSENRGTNWSRTSIPPIDGNNAIVTLAVAPSDSSIIYTGIAPNDHPPAKIFRSTNRGVLWTDISSGLPDRLPMDITIHPNDPMIAYAVFAGFGTDHLFKTENGGQNWAALSNGLPDLPTNTIALDPLFPEYIYVGNDLGVFFSDDGGQSFEVFCSGLPDAVLVMHLSISPSNRKLRVATHGNGVYQTPLIEVPVGIRPNLLAAQSLQLSPNPTDGPLRVQYELNEPGQVRMTLFDLQGKEICQMMDAWRSAEPHEEHFELCESARSQGIFLLRVEAGGQALTKRVVVK